MCNKEQTLLVRKFVAFCVSSYIFQLEMLKLSQNYQFFWKHVYCAGNNNREQIVQSSTYSKRTRSICCCRWKWSCYNRLWCHHTFRCHPKQACTLPTVKRHQRNKKERKKIGKRGIKQLVFFTFLLFFPLPS